MKDKKRDWNSGTGAGLDWGTRFAPTPKGNWCWYCKPTEDAKSLSSVKWLTGWSLQLLDAL